MASESAIIGIFLSLQVATASVSVCDPHRTTAILRFDCTALRPDDGGKAFMVKHMIILKVSVNLCRDLRWSAIGYSRMNRSIGGLMTSRICPFKDICDCTDRMQKHHYPYSCPKFDS